MGILLDIGRFLVLLILSMVQSFNFAIHIPFIILYLYIIKSINFELYIYLSFSLVIYDISKYFFKLFSIKIMKLIGVHEYISFSLGLLILVQLGFSFSFYYNKNLIIFIAYRLFLSLFNNLSSFIIFPMRQLYNNKKIKNRLESFSFYQKFFNFLIFPIGIYILSDLNSFSIICFFLAIINLFCFLLYLIIFICNNKNEKQYYPQISEKIYNKKNNNIVNLIKEQNKISQIINNKRDGCKLKSTKINTISEHCGDNTNLAIISGEIKGKFFLNNKNKNNNIDGNENDNNEASINFCKNINEIEKNKTTKININDNSLKNRLYQKNNNSNMNNSEIINKIESSSDVVLGQFYGSNSKNRTKYEGNNMNNSFQKPKHINKIISSNNISNKNEEKSSSLFNENANIKKNKLDTSNNSIIYLIIMNSIFKFIHYFSIFILFMKFFQSKTFLDEHKIFYLNSSFTEIMILFTCYYFIIMILYIVNKYLTSCIIKGGLFIKYCIFYPLQFIYLLSIIIINYMFLNKNDVHRTNIILIFSFQLIVCESSMILQIFYNKLAIKKGVNQHVLKETKSIGILSGGIIFILINTIRGVFLYVVKIKLDLFDNYFLYATIMIFFLILFVISFFF